MSTAASPSRGHKRKPSEPHDTLGPSASITRGTSPFHPNHASSSTTSSPSKRQSASSSSRRNSRHTRTFQIADDLDGEEDAPYDEELDADGEDDEELLDQDAEGEDAHSLNPEHGALSPRASASTTPARRTARPKRSHAPSVSYYAAQPLPSLSDQEQDEDEKPSIRRRARKTKLLPTSDIDPDMDDDDGDDPEPAPARSSHRGTRTTTPRATKHPSGKVPRRASELDNGAPKPRSSAKPEEPEMSEEAKQLAKAEKEAEDLRSRWTEEYFEIVEQLPLEVHRTFALMRELEGQMQTRLSSMVESMTAYRDARLQMQNQIQARSDVPEQPSLPENSATQRSTNGGSEDEAENLLGGSPNGPLNGLRPSDDGDVEMLSNDGTDRSKVLDKHARQHLLQSISLAATESVKAAEEKMGLAATAYNWIDRHIRRLDADISKLESSILLGLRTGTEESRGAREALGLPVDDGASAERNGQEEQGGDDEAGEGISAEAESAALTKAAGAANRTSSSGKKETVGGRRSARTTPKMGGPAQLVSSPTRSEHARSRSRSRSRSIPASNVTTTTIAPKSTSPAAATRTTRKRKPRPLSPQKGGRKSIVTSAPTLISPTTQTPSSGTTTVGPDTSEMPFDPTEPTYCYCDQISFDEMVACDNEDCSIEWFHYACVGLDAPPKNEWYCRFCAPQGWKGQGMGVPPNAKHKPPGWKKGIGIRP